MANQLVKTLNTSFDKLKSRVIKFTRFGLNDTQTATEVAPFGIDSNPLINMVAVYAETASKGDAVIVGYINKDQLAASGEMRLFSKSANGDLKTFIWLKADGKIQLGGVVDNAVRYSKLKDTIDSVNQFLNEQLPLIAAGIATGGGSYSPGTANFDVTAAKIDEIQTP